MIDDAEFDLIYPLAGRVVDGRRVLDRVPNRGSIAASLNSYKILPGIREVSLDLFEQPPTRTQRTKALADEIAASKTIAPLIVVIDEVGPYILEGAHRYDALKILDATSFPALVVIEKEI